MKNEKKHVGPVIAIVVSACVVMLGIVVFPILKVVNVARANYGVSSFNCCPGSASDRYVVYVGRGSGDKEELICLYDVKTQTTETIYEVANEDFLVYDPFIKGEEVEFKVKDDDNISYVYTYHINTGELTMEELPDDYNYGYEVWRSLTAEVETPEYGTVTLTTEHSNYKYVCTVGDDSFVLDAIDSDLNAQASIYTQDCVYEDGKIYAKVLYHDDPFAKREGYFADHNQADRAAFKEYLVAIDLKEQTSEIIDKSSPLGKRIVGYDQGSVYYFKDSVLYKKDLDSDKKKRIYTAANVNRLAFAWCKNNLVIFKLKSDYHPTYEVDRMIDISD